MSPSSPGIYLHVPFCLGKCHYCDFYSVPLSPKAQEGYLRGILHQIELLKAVSPWRELVFSTIFFGGGTPSILPPEFLTELLNTIRQNFRFTNECPEISIEVNPATIDMQGLKMLKAGGFNRLSIGVQSLLDEELRLIGRRHTRDDALQVFGDAGRVGFDNINLDLMYGLPGQTVARWNQSLEEALQLDPEHLSIYELTLEQGTPLARQVDKGELALPDEETLLRIADSLYQHIANSPFSRYEISNYAKENFTCRHNLNYWHNGSYLGLGPTAVSAHLGKRWTTVADLERFIALERTPHSGLESEERLNREAYFRETVVIGLRMIDGIDLSRLKRRFHMDPITYYGKILDRLIHSRLLEIRDDRLQLTAKGLPLANMVMAELV